MEKKNKAVYLLIYQCIIQKKAVSTETLGHTESLVQEMMRPLFVFVVQQTGLSHLNCHLLCCH